MAGKPKSMSTIKQLLQLYKRGKSKKYIARSLGISRNTVKSYLDKLSHLDKDISELMQLENPELEKQFHTGNPAYKEDRYSHLKDRLDHYSSELKRTGVTRQLLWEEYKSDYPNGYGRSQFFFHLSQHRKASKPSMVQDHKPGEKLYIDFAGKKLSYIDQLTGEQIECTVFVASLPFSDYGFACAIHNQSIGEFLNALRLCLEFLGGVPQVLVPDNFKAAVIKADNYEPKINKALEDFANHYGMTVIPARPRKPKDKALAENKVKLVYGRVYAKIRNQLFFSQAALNSAIMENMLTLNQTRMQGRDYCREEKFLAHEKKYLSPLPKHPFELKKYRTYKVQPNNHILLGEDNHYYSVPFIHIGKNAKVIYTHNLVRIFIEGDCVATHQRDRTRHGYTSDKNHLCSTHRHYLNRSPGYYIRQASRYCEELHNFTRLLFEQNNKHPEQLYRTCDGVFNLYRKSADKEQFKKACNLAINRQKFSSGFIKNLLKNKIPDQTGEIPFKDLPEHNNLRGKKYYS